MARIEFVQKTTLIFHGTLLALLWIWRNRNQQSFDFRIPAFGCLSLLLTGLGPGLFGTLRLLSWSLFFYWPLACWVLGPTQTRRWRRFSMGTTISLALVAIYAFQIEPNHLEITFTELETDKLSESLRIVVIADLQTEEISDYDIRALQKASRLNADLVLLTGDYYTGAGPKGREAMAAQLLRHWQQLAQAPLGAYAVRGNNEYSNWTDLFEGTGIQAFAQTSSLSLESLDLWALDLDDSFNPHWVGPPNSHRLVVAFGHAPDFALSLPKVDLVVAGHTHGGQVQIPGWGPLIKLSRVPRQWASGLTLVEESFWLYVSRGIGMERGLAPQLRFFCRPEIAVIDLKPEPGES